MAEVLAADGTPLKRSLARSLRARKRRAFLLVLPLLAFILLTFVLPIADMLFRSVENGIVADTLPRTVVALETWDPKADELPPDAAFDAMRQDLVEASEAKTHTRVGTRLNYQEPGISSLFRKSGRGVERMDAAAPLVPQFEDIDEGWAEPAVWRTIKLYSPRYTEGYFLNALDMEKTVDGPALKPDRDRIYVKLFIRSLVLSLVITFMTLLLGYPVAFMLASLPARHANLLMILVLLPFWTSLLVRTSAWKVLLQNQGVINDLLVWARIISNEGRLALINNQTGTIIAMTHILLPFMILPLFSVMKTIPPSFVRAARSLGANPWTAFWRVYFPQSLPGIGAGAILVFILAIGYYITPELVGGTQGTFISNRIAYHISSSLNWGLGAALGTLLLLFVLALYWVYDRLVGIDKVKLG